MYEKPTVRLNGRIDILGIVLVRRFDDSTRIGRSDIAIRMTDSSFMQVPNAGHDKGCVWVT